MVFSGGFPVQLLLDTKRAAADSKHWAPIHREAPPFVDQSTEQEVLSTGIKVRSASISATAAVAVRGCLKSTCLLAAILQGWLLLWLSRSKAARRQLTCLGWLKGTCLLAAMLQSSLTLEVAR